MSIAPSLADVRRGWRYPQSVVRFAERLLTQQIWCFGQDIQSPHGNLLMEYGFQRHREESLPSVGSTCYRFDDEERQINLWGFGLFYGERELGGLYLRRYKFQPQWTRLESIRTNIHRAEKLPAFSRPNQADEWRRADQLCDRMMNWIADYESWVLLHMGPEYRRQSLQRCSRPICEGEQMAACWRFLGCKAWEEENSDWESQLGGLRERQGKVSP